jgi:peptidoglycan/LPS O-acetylase OafA/YrhL
VTANEAIEQAFPFYTAALGGSAILLALKAEAAFRRYPFLVKLGDFLGRTSYSTYLFHLLVLSAVTSLALPVGWPILLAAFLALTLAVATLMYMAIEAPILAARPRFKNFQD